LWHRWNHVRERVPLLWRGLPHGCNPHVDISRRLTHTTVETIFDVGANRGQSAADFRRWYPRAIIHCFEPVTATFGILQKAVSHDAGVRTHQVGLGASAGTRMIALSSDDRMSHVGPAGTIGRTESIVVDTLDTFCVRERIGRIDYLKVDTEGADLAVLEGASQFLGSASAAIVEVEAGLNPESTYHASAQSLTDYLVRYGYRLFTVYEQVLEWPTADAYLRRANLVFVSPETIRCNHWVG
jgi:FkbM family methyltransferase